jgi:uncharacterized protein (DUF885 family)
MNDNSAKAVAQVAEDALQLLLDLYPVGATLLGLRDRDDRLADYTEAGDESARSRLGAIVVKAEAIDPAGLDATDRVTRSVVRQMAEAVRDQYTARMTEYTITDSMFAPAVELLSMLPMVGLGEPAHADAYLMRLRRLPEALAAIADRHRAGMAARRLPVKRLVEAAVAYLDRYLADPDADPLRRPQPPGDATAFGAERDRLLADVVRPAVARYREVLAIEVAPHGRPEERPGMCWLPDGPVYYAGLVRAHTTTGRSPEELHRVGLSLIDGLAQEYATVGRRLFGTGEVREILDRVRTDPALRWRDGDELLAEARAAIARAEQAAPAWFGTLPGQGCTVEPVPEAEAPGAPAAYYLPPALDGGRPGIYFANTHRADQRGRATYEAVAFHEAVPGHHFQLTRALELTELPMVRRLGGFTAYHEGWGLYAERLADEMGLYSGDLYRLGMLSEDSMRAARLVVDTGLHDQGWNRQQAVDYLVATTATPLVEIESEVDRYISAPGQALAYMVGRMEIQRMRQEAEAALGDRFDIRAFHDTVLGSGALPLTVLDEVVRAWVTETGRVPR